MKVKDLVDILKNEDQEAYVILSSDAEGNSFSPCDDWGKAFLPPGWEGGRIEDVVDQQDIDLEYDEVFDDGDDSEIDKYTKVVILWPI